MRAGFVFCTKRDADPDRAVVGEEQADMASDVGVVITGLGATTPLGGDVQLTWKSLLSGRTGVRRVDDQLSGNTGPSALPVRIGAPMAVAPDGALPPDEAARLDRGQQAAVVAAREAWLDAGSPQVDPVRLAVVVGTAMGGLGTLVGEHDALHREGAGALARLGVARSMPAGPAAAVAVSFGARAGTYAPASACAAGAESVLAAARLIRSGEADVVLAGGVDAGLVPVVLASFARTGALSRRNDDPEAASRPFDVDRDGFVLGEGAAMLVLERSEVAAARGARPLARLAGAAATSDGFDFMKPDPSGEGQRRALTGALSAAGLSPSDVDYVSCHATATKVGDLAEAASVRAVLGDGAVVTAVKGATGHLLGGAGALASVLAVESIRESVIPHARNLGRLDPGVGLDVVAGAPRPGDVRAVLCNAFGFGGFNVSLLITACS
jgi:3-oxoacyl-[acyl-carrier-protein] synthase II